MSNEEMDILISAYKTLIKSLNHLNILLYPLASDCPQPNVGFPEIEQVFLSRSRYYLTPTIFGITLSPKSPVNPITQPLPV